MAKIGRNDPCPCGSKKKYKWCCMDRNQLEWRLKTNLPIIKKKFGEINAKQRALDLAWQKKYGFIKSVIYSDWNGKKVVAVGNKVLFLDKCKTFHDFLFEYIKTELGSEWGTSELNKPYKKRHQIIKWYDDLCKFQQNKSPDENGIYSEIMNGPVAAYLNLACDLYIVSHNMLLKDHFLARLKDPIQFQGARYELLVTAACIKAGFEIQHEDERDGTSRHVEFICWDKRLNEKITIEAKSKHRSGILGQPGEMAQDDDPKTRVGRLLNDALSKDPKIPYIVFVDVNCPPSDKPLEQQRWVKDIMRSSVLRNDENGIDRFNAIIFTNYPHHYGKDNEPEPKRSSLLSLATRPRYPTNHPDSINRIWNAIQLFGKIPHEFPPIIDETIEL